MKTRTKFTRENKISILRELENGKSAAQVCRENGIHPSMLSKWNRILSGSGILNMTD
ncbi:MAG: transposase [ANME-2 cluster archaeon]|jgi:transposase-like protein|nr:transposase [ANME-2 cluster archaeon]